MERIFDHDLNKLKAKLYEMGDLVETQIHHVVNALIEGDVQLAKKIAEGDNQIDNMDVKIDKLCQRIFALNQPVASDLRFIMASLKINNELERLGDIAVSIAERIEPITDYPEMIHQFKIDNLANQSEELTKRTISCLKKGEVSDIEQIRKLKNEVKEENQRILNEILQEMTKKSEVIVVATNLVIILRHLERLAGHCSNILESIVFIIEGKIIKHSKEI